MYFSFRRILLRLVRMLIDKVTVFDDKLTVEFKSGAEIEV
jgi:site-specific DNA recombinase